MTSARVGRTMPDFDSVDALVSWVGTIGPDVLREVNEWQPTATSQKMKDTDQGRVLNTWPFLLFYEALYPRDSGRVG
jgi:hypothetical protein